MSTTRPNRGARARLLRLGLLLPLLVTPGCLSGDGGLQELLLRDLDPKLIPVLIEDDGDLKDVLYKSRTKYKPKTAEGKVDKRLMLKAKGDDAALRAVLERDFIASPATIHARLGFDPGKLAGLVDGTSLVFLELVLDTAADGGAPSRFLEAVYDEASGGLLIRATDGESVLGTPLLLDGEAEAVVQFRDTGTELVYEAGPVTGPFFFDFDVSELHTEALADGAPAPRTVAWGVQGLDKGGTFFLTQLVLGGVAPVIGVAETSIEMTLASAFDSAFEASSFFGADLATTTGHVGDARLALEQARSDIEAALGAADGEGFGPLTQGELALTSVDKALKLAVKAEAQGDKLLSKGKTNAKGVQKKADKVLRFVQLAMSQIAGFKSKSVGKPFKTGAVVSPF